MPRLHARPLQLVTALATHFVRNGGTILQREVKDIEIGGVTPALSTCAARQHRVLTRPTLLSDFAAMNAVWEAWVAKETAPVRPTVEARLAHSALLVEMTAVAAAG